MLASSNKSTINKGTEKRLSMKNAVAYSLLQAKLDNPARNCTADLSDAALKKAKLRQKTLKVMTRCVQMEKKLALGKGRSAFPGFAAAGKM